MRRGPKLLVVACAAVGLLIPVGTATGGAQEEELDDDALVFLGQSPWHSGSGDVRLRLAIAAPRNAENLEVAVTLFRRVAYRSQFAQTLEGRIRPSVLQNVRVRVADLEADAAGAVTVRFSPEDLGANGVYPVRVELRESRGGPVIDSLVTYLLHVPEEIDGDRLTVATVLPVHSRPSIRPDGEVVVERATRVHAAAVANALRSAPGVPATLLPTAETVDALASTPQGEGVIDALRTAAADRHILARHYVHTSLPALLRAGLEDEVTAQRSRAVDTLEQHLDQRPATRTWIATDGVDEDTLEFLRRNQFDRVVLPEGALERIDRSITLAETFHLDAGPRPIRAAAADPGLAAHFERDVDPALAAQQLLADLTVLYLDRPGLERGVVVLPDTGWQPNGRFLSAFLGGLSTSPVLAPVDLEEFFQAVPDAQRGRRTLVRELAEEQRAGITLPGRALRQIRSRTESFATALEPGNPVYDVLDRTLLAAQAADIGRRARERYQAGVLEQVDRQLALVELPESRTITLTAREGEIPITVTSEAPYTLNVVLRVASGTLSFPNGDTRLLQIVHRNTTARIQVDAKASGSFPMQVRLESPDGAIVLGESRFTIRSTAISGVGVALSVGAGAFLLVWWGRHLRGRRSRKLVPA